MTYRALLVAVGLVVLSFASVAQTPNGSADLSIEKTASPDPVTAGGLLTYVLRVTNNGPDTAENVVVTDNLPSGLQFVSSSTPCEALADGSLICPLGALAAGATAQPITIMVQVPTTLSGLITNIASVHSVTLDNNPANDTDQVTTQVEPPVVPESADLGLTKTASVARIMPGDTFDYTLTVSNQGPNAAQNVVLFDVLPQGLSLVNASAGCAGATTVRCDVASLDAGASTTAVLTVQAGADVTGQLSNTASVAAQSPDDPNPGNNMATATVVVETPTPPAPLSLLPTDTVLPDGFVGQPYSVIFSADGGQAPLALGGANAPPGLDFFTVGNAAPTRTGNELELRGIPTRAGSYIVRVSVTDSTAPPSTIVRDYMLTIGTALDVRPLSLPVTQVGESLITTFMTANGIPPDSFTSIDPLPPGFELNGNSLTGTPTEVGEFRFTIEATDAAGNQGARDYTLSVLPAGLLILTDTLPDAVVDASYGAQVRALGGVKPYAWRVDGALPEGIGFSNTGFFSGRPTGAGTGVVRVTVRDQTGSEASADLPLTVNATGLVSLTPGLFPDGLLGAPYKVPILPDGGTPQYECRLADGQLPPGLTISGCATTIGGTPAFPGTFEFTIEVSDDSSPPLTTMLSRRIRVAEQPPLPVGTPPSLDPDNTVDVPVPDSAVAGPGDQFPDEALEQIAVDAYGNHYLAGYTHNGSDYDLRLVKLDAMDNLVFDRRFDSGDHDFGLAVAISPLDQSVYVGGYTRRGARSRALLVKYDIAGTLRWVRRDASIGRASRFEDLAADRSGVYAAGERVGRRRSDGLVAKYGHDGVLLWEYARPTVIDEVVRRVAAAACADDPDVTCSVIIGGTIGKAGRRGWLARLDPHDGRLVHARVLPTTPVEGLALAGDDVIVGGANAGRTWRITRVGPDFRRIWSTRHRPGETLRALALDLEGNVYAVGGAPGLGDDGVLVVLAGNGDVLDELRFDEGVDERFSDVVIGPAGQLIVAGERGDAQGTEFLVLRLDNGKAF